LKKTSNKINNWLDLVYEFTVIQKLPNKKSTVNFDCFYDFAIIHKLNKNKFNCWLWLFWLPSLCIQCTIELCQRKNITTLTLAAIKYENCRSATIRNRNCRRSKKIVKIRWFLQLTFKLYLVFSYTCYPGFVTDTKRVANHI